MNWEVSYDEKENILFVKTYGILDVKTNTAMTKECIEMVKEKNCSRWLIDNRKITRQAFGTLDIHSLPTLYDELGFPRHVRLAEVTLKEYASDFSFYETVCRNRGYMVSVFYDVESALQWLKK
jgi:hypothetical protein